MSLCAVMRDDFFGGAVLADDSLGSVSLTTSFGEVLNIHVSDDPELMMSGLHEPCGSFEKW